MIRKLTSSECGYSLVEVMVAIVLLSIAIIPMVGMFDAGLRAALVGGNYDKGRALANERLEEIKALPFSSPDPEPASNTANSVEEIYRPLNAASPSGSVVTGTEGIFAYEVRTNYASLTDTSIVPDPLGKALIQVQVTVRWDGNKSYTATGIVAQKSPEPR